MTDVPAKGHFEYWPQEGEELKICDTLTITNEKEDFFAFDQEKTMIERIFSIMDADTDEPLLVRHIQLGFGTNHKIKYFV